MAPFQITVLGTGMMGPGIAAGLAQAGDNGHADAASTGDSAGDR